MSKKLGIPVGTIGSYLRKYRESNRIEIKAVENKMTRNKDNTDIMAEIKAIYLCVECFPSFHESAKARVKKLMNLLEDKYV